MKLSENSKLGRSESELANVTLYEREKSEVSFCPRKKISALGHFFTRIYPQDPWHSASLASVRDSWTAGAFPCLAAGQLGLRLRAAGQLFSFDRWCIKEAAGELLVVGRQTAVGEFAKKWGQISMEGRQYKTDPSPWCSSWKNTKKRGKHLEKLNT